MTNKNIPLSHEPFLLKPAGKGYLWGGKRLIDDYGKNLEMMPLAETWECSTHPDGPSKVASGIFSGQTLERVIQEHSDFLGKHPFANQGLPILVKFIDAKASLSIQVHPDDEYAMKHEKGQMGKSELWYVLDAAPNAFLFYGLHHKINRETLRQSILDGTIEKHLQKIMIKKNDLFYVKAGTIHAIGAGALIAEIQQSSDLTYRLYDYNRTDQNGCKRTLHIEKALDVADLNSCAAPRQPLRVLNYRQGCASEFLCRSKYFEVHRLLVNTENCRTLVPYQSDDMSFRVLLCINGCGDLVIQNGKIIQIFKGDCIFFPANSMATRLHGKMQFLDVRC